MFLASNLIYTVKFYPIPRRSGGQEKSQEGRVGGLITDFGIFFLGKNIHFDTILAMQCSQVGPSLLSWSLRGTFLLKAPKLVSFYVPLLTSGPYFMNLAHRKILFVKILYRDI